MSEICFNYCPASPPASNDFTKIQIYASINNGLFPEMKTEKERENEINGSIASVRSHKFFRFFATQVCAKTVEYEYGSGQYCSANQSINGQDVKTSKLETARFRFRAFNLIALIFLVAAVVAGYWNMWKLTSSLLPVFIFVLVTTLVVSVFSDVTAASLAVIVTASAASFTTIAGTIAIANGMEGNKTFSHYIYSPPTPHCLSPEWLTAWGYSVHSSW